MTKRSKRKARPADQTISWKRVRAIFDYPEPPKQVWERQFDYNDEKLLQLAQTPYDEIDFSDLWYYHHDLAYVDLQPELFAYLFPVCLMDWHQTLMRNEPCSHGDSEFHCGIHRGNVFEKMLTLRQQQDVCEFFRDSFLARLDVERGFPQDRHTFPTYGWMGRFNSLGVIIPKVELIWNTWWSLDTHGRAIAAIQYCSGLMYFDGENPLFEAWEGAGPCLWENDSYCYDVGWLHANTDFLMKTLTVDYVNEKVTNAVARLPSEPGFEKAKQIEKDLPDRQDVIAGRVNELPSLLCTPNTRGWTV